MRLAVPSYLPPERESVQKGYKFLFQDLRVDNVLIFSQLSLDFIELAVE